MQTLTDFQERNWALQHRHDTLKSNLPVISDPAEQLVAVSEINLIRDELKQDFFVTDCRRANYNCAFCPNQCM